MDTSRLHEAGRLARRVGTTIGAALLAGGAALVVTPPPPASAAGQSFYAYAGGAGHSATDCPRTADIFHECTLTEALADVTPGGTVFLATPASAGSYYGDYVLRTPSTSASAPVTIAPASGVLDPTLDGDYKAGVPCPTAACNGPVLTVRSGIFAKVESLTITDDDNTASSAGGGIDDANAAALTVSQTTFSAVGAPDGGGIDYQAASGTLTVANSTFVGDGANDGGALDISGPSAKVVDSTFQSDSAGDGGAIDVGDHGASGTIVVSGSTFTAGGAVDGGAIADGEHGGVGNVTIHDATFSGNGASNGGAIDNADYQGTGTLVVTNSLFAGNGSGDGGAVDSGDFGGIGTLTVVASTFVDNGAGEGGALDSADHGGQDTFSIEHSTLTGGDVNVGGALDNGDHHGDGSGSIVSTTIDGNGGAESINNANGRIGIAGSIVAGSGVNCAGALTDDGYNLEDDASASCGFSSANQSIVGEDPDLGPLQSNGGFTDTMAPGPGSPVLGRIPNPTRISISGTPRQLCPAKDQRGVAAPASGCAIGSVDIASSPPS